MVSLSIYAQGPFAPQVGQHGCTAIHADSTSVIAWANSVHVVRGKQNIASLNSDTTSVGDWSQATGKANGAVVSLGDSGVATLQFDGRIYNGVGNDFVVFENAFNHTFLELAFVEVSSNGIDFYRFPSRSLTDTSVAVGSFGSVSPSNVHNLAGKYTVLYGTPFDLADLDSVAGLDLNSISHVRIVDAIGTIDAKHAQRDSKGQIVNDQFPTPFPSGGFDLDAVGVIYMNGVGLQNAVKFNEVSVYPNPSNGMLTVEGVDFNEATFKVISMEGKLLKQGSVSQRKIDLTSLLLGYYSLLLENGSTTSHHKIIVR